MRNTQPNVLYTSSLLLVEHYGLPLISILSRVSLAIFLWAHHRLSLVPSQFSSGYPGIPSGPPDRPQAAVKGVRVGLLLSLSSSLRLPTCRRWNYVLVVRVSRLNGFESNSERLRRYQEEVSQTHSSTLWAIVQYSCGSRVRSIPISLRYVQPPVRGHSVDLTLYGVYLTARFSFQYSYSRSYSSKHLPGERW